MEEDLKWCGNCRYYIEFFGDNRIIEICCRHRVRVVAEENICCYRWEYDDLHDNATVDGCFKKNDQSVPDKE